MTTLKVREEVVTQLCAEFVKIYLNIADTFEVEGKDVISTSELAIACSLLQVGLYTGDIHR